MTKKIVKPVLSKNRWGLVRMDATAKLQWELNGKAEEEKSMKRNLWKSDWRK